jgi:hypothetical protein
MSWVSIMSVGLGSLGANKFVNVLALAVCMCIH